MPKGHKGHDQQQEADGEQRTGPRPAWSGSLSFGLVSIPVGLYSTLHSAGPRAHLFAEDGSALRRRYYCPADEQDLEDSDLVRGFERPDKPGTYVEVLDEELTALAPKKSREIALQSFCERASLHASLFERGYVLIPQEAGAKAYKLLAEAMQRADRAGIATFVLRERAYIVAILAQDGLLLAETLRFADELRSPSDVGLPKREAPSKTLVSQLSRSLLAKQRGRFDPYKLVDPAHKKLEQLVAAKAKRGDVVQVPEAEPETAAQSGEVVDLMAMLKNSLQQSERKRSKAG